MSVSLSPYFNGQQSNFIGGNAVGWKVGTYVAGSNTPLASFTSSTGLSAQTNPVIYGALGFPQTGQLWLTDGSAYKLVLMDDNNVVWATVDNVYSVGSGGGAGATVSQFQLSTLSPTYISTTSFSLLGDQTNDFHVGRRLQFQTTGGTVYGTIASSVYTTLTTVTMTMDTGMVLDAGLSAVYLSILRADHSAVPGNISRKSTITASGSYIVPLGVNTIYLSMCGGGGGGGGSGAGKSTSSSSSNGTQGGGGGGAGAFILNKPVAVTPGQTLTVAIGAAGALGAGGVVTAGSPAAGTNGSSGGATSVTGTGVSESCVGGTGGGGSALGIDGAAGGSLNVGGDYGGSPGDVTNDITTLAYLRTPGKGGTGGGSIFGIPQGITGIAGGGGTTSSAGLGYGCGGPGGYGSFISGVATIVGIAGFNGQPGVVYIEY